ncbi:hypothetical protein E2C01_075360 [Portunus trituberculatus]|uniref:Uncharacterized protein n=1 Tax=Portunus trituberculatus TaxID=210409 RepID=A0A5B7IIY0_PORTR|nr:hypothetical protein [Portunus trituberculatus]
MPGSSSWGFVGAVQTVSQPLVFIVYKASPTNRLYFSLTVPQKHYNGEKKKSTAKLHYITFSEY